MNPTRVLQLARYQGTRDVDLGSSAAADHQAAVRTLRHQGAGKGLARTSDPVPRARTALTLT